MPYFRVRVEPQRRHALEGLSTDGSAVWSLPCYRSAFIISMRSKLERQGAQVLRPLRSGQMIDCLRQNFLYSEKRARDLLFGASESLVRGSNGVILILCRLTREAASLAQRDAAAIGFEFSNWDVASNAVIRAMLNAGVLLGRDGAPVSNGIAAQATPICGLEEDYRDRTEAYLIELLIRKLGNVTTRDHRAVAHALFRQFDRSIPMDYFEDRVAMLMATLADRIVLNEVGAYAVRNEVPARIAITH